MASHSSPNPRWGPTLILLLLGFVWGSSFILMKWGLFASDGSPLFPPLELAALRIAIAGIALLPVSITHWKKLSGPQWLWVSFIGIVAVAIGHTFNYKRDFYIPVEDVTRTEEERTRILAAGV